jgi:hypothetical protein
LQGENSDKNKSYGKHFYQTHKLVGLCTRCNKKAIPGFALCKHHIEVQRVNSRKLYQSHKNSGTCVKCREKATPDSSLCAIHLEVQKASSLKSYQTHRNAGTCTRCDKEAIPGATLCALHLAERRIISRIYYKTHSLEVIAKNEARYQKYKREGKCATCGRLLIEKESLYCLTCRNAHRERNKERARNNSASAEHRAQKR